MTTFATDVLQINFAGGIKLLLCKAVNVDWPPPERLDIMGFKFKRVAYSAISDEEMQRIIDYAIPLFLGALYVPADGLDKLVH